MRLSQKQHFLLKNTMLHNADARKVVNHYKNTVVNENLLFLRKIFPNSKWVRNFLTDLPENDGIKTHLPNNMSLEELGITKYELYNLLVKKRLINYGDLQHMQILEKRTPLLCGNMQRTQLHINGSRA